MSVCSHCGARKAGSFATCPRCGREEPVEPSDPSVVPLLAELRPEAEPPLPAEHESLRPRTPVPAKLRPADQKPPPRSVIAAVVDSPMAAAPGPIVDPSAWFEDSSPGTAGPPAPQAATAPPAQPAPEDEARPLPPAPYVRKQALTPLHVPAPTPPQAQVPGVGLNESFSQEVTTSARRRVPMGERTTAPMGAPALPEKRDDAAPLPVLGGDDPVPSLAPRSNRTIIVVVLLILIGAVAGVYFASPSTTTDANGPRGAVSSGLLLRARG